MEQRMPKVGEPVQYWDFAGNLRAATILSVNGSYVNLMYWDSYSTTYYYMSGVYRKQEYNSMPSNVWDYIY